MNASSIKNINLDESIDRKLPASFYEVLFNNASDAMLIINCDNWTIQSVNSQAEKLTGYVSQDLIGHNVDKLFPNKSDADNTVFLRALPLNLDAIANDGFFEDLIVRKKDGYLAYVSMSVRILSQKSTGVRPVSLCIIRDTLEKKKMERELITKHTELRKAFVELEKAHFELKSAQEALVQAGKLASLGELSAGVAHELNQPLTGVLGFTQELKSLIQSKKDSDPVILSHCKEIEKNSIRMSKIIGQLREFTRKNTEDFQNHDIRKIIDESLELLSAQFRSRGIEVSVKEGTAIPQIYCNPFQMEQVFINLATNARDAIELQAEPNGTIDIQINKISKDFIEVTFRDNGCGMANSTRQKAFDPFFTTKEVGKGTGLGLSVSFGILSQIHASMTVNSDPGKGTEFRIKIPIDYRNLTEREEEKSNG